MQSSSSSSVLIVPAPGSQNNLDQHKSTVIILPSNFIPITKFSPFINQQKQIKKERPIKPNLKPKPLINEPSVTFDVLIPKPVKKRKTRSSAKSSSSSSKKQKLDSIQIKEEKIEIENNLSIKKSYGSNSFNNLNKTELSRELFDSIEYLSTSWNSIYSTGNDTEPKVLDLFRQFHCADCLKSFQEQQQNRVKMNTPPPPLQPIYQDTIDGLNNYFGLSNNQVTNLRLLPINSNRDTQNSNFKTPLNQDIYHLDIQEKKLSLSLKLAQRRPKQELVERGIIPSPRFPIQHYDQAKHLQKAHLQGILENKLEKRPNRELLVQKNILPDSKAAPSLQLKCNELKRARLADDLNEKLAKRPGPLELVESGILVSPDTSLTEAIKGGKITYPKTSVILNRHHPYSRPEFFNESNLNFNFNSLTDNEDSNASQTSNSTSKTTNTLASLSSSSVASFLNNQNIYENISSPFGSDPIESPSKMSNKSNSSNRKLKSSSSVLSSASSLGKSNKKTLIFHQYLGPNQKISKTTLKSYQKPGRIQKTKSSSSSLFSDNTNTNNNELHSDNNSNDSNGNFCEEEEMNAYKIRLEQQKMFLSFNNSPKQQAEIVEMDTEIKSENNASQSFQTPNQPIQLVPIGDVKILDNLQNLLINNGLVPILINNNNNNTNSDINSNSKQMFQIDSKNVQLVETKCDGIKVETTPCENSINLENLSVNALKEECSKRKLSKSGPKQKLIERLREFTKKELGKQTIKSPDSGVCMDNSPSFNTCELSPVGSGSTTKSTTIDRKSEAKSSNLDEFFDFLNVETMGKKKTEIVESVASVKEDDKDLSQTALTLEESLKKSAEFLKQLSSAGQLDHLHKLEKQMQQSMQLIEKLKLASNKQVVMSNSQQNLEQNNQEIKVETNLINNTQLKGLRVINSMPCNLRDLGLQQTNNTTQHVLYQPKNDGFIRGFDDSQFINTNKLNIPILISSNLNDQNKSKIDNVTSLNNLQFNSNEQTNKQVLFTTNSLQDLHQNQSINLYSNNSTKSSASSSIESTSSSSNQNTHLDNMDWNDPEIFQLCHDFTDHDNLISSSNQANSNFNEQFLLNLNQNDNQQSYIQQNQQRTCDPLMNASDNFLSWDILEPDYNQIMAGYLQSPTI